MENDDGSYFSLATRSWSFSSIRRKADFKTSAPFSHPGTGKAGDGPGHRAMALAKRPNEATTCKRTIVLVLLLRSRTLMNKSANPSAIPMPMSPRAKQVEVQVNDAAQSSRSVLLKRDAKGSHAHGPLFAFASLAGSKLSHLSPLFFKHQSSQISQATHNVSPWLPNPAFE